MTRTAKQLYREKNKDRANAQRRARRSDATRATERAYRKRNRDRINAYHREWQRKWHRRLRLEVIEHYGGQCECCGETTEVFLQIDHIEGGGSRHRQQLGKAGAQFYTWLKKNNWPDGFRVLCANCNTAFARLGYCPHGQEPSPAGE